MGFKCRWCRAVFDTYIDWKSHEDVHMDLDDLGAEIESYNTCRWCSAEFTSASEFLEHEHIHEQLDELTGISSISLECPWCEAIFDDRNEFDLHFDIHKQLEDLGAFMPAKRCKIDDNISSPSPLPGASTEFIDVFDSLPAPSMDSDDCVSNQQSGGGNGDQLVYEIEKVGQKTFQNRVIDRHYRVKFNPDQVLEGQKLSDLNVELENMFDDVLNEAKKDLKGSDLGRVIIHHDDLINPIYVPLRPLDDLNADTVLNYLENTLTSHQDLAMDDGFYLDVGTMELPAGGRGNVVNSVLGPHSSLVNKKSILEITNQDDTCLARAILLGYLRMNTLTTDVWKSLTRNDSSMSVDDLVMKYKVCPHWYFKMIRRDQHANRQTVLIQKFCEVIDIPVDRFLTINDISPFEEFLDVDVLVKKGAVKNTNVKNGCVSVVNNM
ncbi:hypothetical protein KUTeg_021980 [Tegillarca granosa]|uniref:C2H2-type domain-containing protein n=1 Tax=Tegillarca granosa TaxID=220873 RepID=A0ABQ9E9H7_TEGGR|nr:hypothetical protein KUTeg_021980 [Tegillarca granosa]